MNTIDLTISNTERAIRLGVATSSSTSKYATCAVVSHPLMLCKLRLTCIACMHMHAAVSVLLYLLRRGRYVATYMIHNTWLHPLSSETRTQVVPLGSARLETVRMVVVVVGSLCVPSASSAGPTSGARARCRGRATHHREVARDDQTRGCPPPLFCSAWSEEALILMPLPYTYRLESEFIYPGVCRILSLRTWRRLTRRCPPHTH